MILTRIQSFTQHISDFILLAEKSNREPFNKDQKLFFPTSPSQINFE